MKALGTAALGAVLLTATPSPSRADNIVVWRTIIGIEQQAMWSVVSQEAGSLGRHARARS
jgi:hypothetical protein